MSFRFEIRTNLPGVSADPVKRLVLFAHPLVISPYTIYRSNQGHRVGRNEGRKLEREKDGRDGR